MLIDTLSYKLFKGLAAAFSFLINITKENLQNGHSVLKSVWL